MATTSLQSAGLFQRYGYAWVTFCFFILALVGHWLFAWFAYQNEQREHGQPADASGYLVEVSRDTLENWQSEFLQLLWQVGGLAALLYVGSPQSKEGNERLEAKIDALLRKTDPTRGEAIIRQLNREYLKS